MAFTYTEDQQKVIDARNRNVLVSAAAGSGKTAVLVERIISMVSDREHPVNIDSLLIVTFTNAAAAEMRERISNALHKKLESDIENVHLQKQITLLHNAQITTIDSFCLFLIRNHFHTIGLDPGFRIGDEGECKLLKQDVLQELLEEQFAKEENEEFLRVVETFAQKANEKPLEDKILQIYEFSMSFPWPEVFLQERQQDYVVENMEVFQTQAWAVMLFETIVGTLREDKLLLETAKDLCYGIDGPISYSTAIESDLETIALLCESATLEELYGRLATVKHVALSRKKDKDVDESKKNMVKAMRDTVKEELKSITKRFFSVSPKMAYEQMQYSRQIMDTLLDLVLLFKEKFDQKKREKNIIDFHDMEHFALQILIREEEESGEYLPSETALEHRKYFHEIMIDEYQDSNMVQEYLLQSISGEDEGNYNRFMVGDVKQSIYKFRLARPEIFLEKFHQYGLEDAQTQRIDLHKNFRSREEVIDTVNYIFYQIMGKELGNVEYDKKAALFHGASYPERGQYKTEHDEGIEFDEGIERDEAIEFEEGIERDEAIEFEEGIELNEEIEFCGETGVGNETEILLVELQEDNKKTKDYAKEVEAKAIASKIHELLDDFQVTDKKSGELRKARYQDIVILLRTNSGWDEVFKRELNEAGIPVYIGSKTGYFSATEIKNIMNYLRIIDNPMQDIPLFGVMKSFFGNFTDAEIGWIKSRTCGKLYESLRFCVDSEEADLISLKRGMAEDGFVQQETSVIENVVSGILNLDLIAKIQQFLQRLERFREKVAYQPIHQLLQDLLDETGYLFYVSALPAGEQRTANVKMLLEKAIAFEKTSYFGLFHFIRYMEQMEKYDIDYGEANTLGEESDTVRIMSIHKSKGLEFPICFVAGITKRFNQMDANQNLVLDMDYGIGMDYIHEKDRIKRSDMRKSAISWKMKLDNLGEELRIFYVALTRAKEKLILTGAVEKLDKQLQAVAYLTDWENEKLPTNVRSSANHYFDFLLGALMRHPDFQKILIGKEMLVAVKKKQVLVAPKLKIQLISPESLIQERVEQGLLKENRRILLEEAVKENRKEQLLFQQLEEKFNFRYEKKILQKLSTKTTITELKKATMVEENEAYQDLFQEPELVPYIPKFKEKEENVVGTERGNAYHRVLELLQFDQLEDLHAYQQQMEVLVAKQRISKEYETLISSKKIMNFAHSNLGKRMVEAKKRNQLWKEQPFVMGVTANRLGEEFPETEQVLIQGIIDAYFIEEGEIVLVDYKTDRVKTKEELKSRYHVQLEYYKEALEKLTGLGVKESVIYSFALGKEISLV